jgi:phenylalanyl-tRNA synthetase beta chain
MNISFNWLKQFIDIPVSAEETAQLLTDIGLEVDGVERVESVKGGLQGLVIGEVLKKEKHPDADRLSVTEVNVGNEVLQIVCGASNVAAGQKVVVATDGTTIYPTNGEPFKIKKSKIRGVESNGMICAEDEIGLGTNHDGIMVLDANAKVGSLAKDYFNMEEDYRFEIGLTPNRADAMSHLGVARDLLAVMKHKKIVSQSATLNTKHQTLNNNSQTPNTKLTVEVKNSEACPRYCGITIENVEVKESPDWLKNKLRSIGASPINNVVDVTNYVLHALGQPLHAFDLDKITSEKVVVKTCAENTAFVTLDEQERKLSSSDLMICNGDEPMCMAGVFGGLHSGVSASTKNIFLESAYFNPTFVRKTAKRHGLNTDASFRFERGIDPNITVDALNYAAQLIAEVSGGTVTGEVVDIYPNKIENFNVKFRLSQLRKISGIDISEQDVKNILSSLEINIVSQEDDVMELDVPAYRVDVHREVDVIEDIIRIYGLNEVPVPEKVNASLSFAEKPSKTEIENIIADTLVANGFSEAMSNSLASSKHIELKGHAFKSEHNVGILNPLSSDLDVLRQTILFNALEAVAHNQNRKVEDVKLFEFGNVYAKYAEKYVETQQLCIVLSGNRHVERWNTPSKEVSFFTLKGVVELILNKLGINKNVAYKAVEQGGIFSEGLSIEIAKKKVVQLGVVNADLLKAFDVKKDVYYAEFNWDVVFELLSMNKVKYTPVSKYPAVRRDLSLLLDSTTTFEQLQTIARKCDNKLLKEIDLFDVYEGKNLEQGKKSYALSFILQDETQTLTDKVIDNVMQKIQSAYEKELGAKLRS